MVNVVADAYSTEVFPGKISAINPIVESTTRNILVRATLANPDGKLLPGMFANVALDQGDMKKYLTLPQTAITYNPYGSTVFVLAAPAADAKDALKDDKGQAYLAAQQVFVTTGPTRGDQVAILTGLKEGQTVVTSGQLKLKNGTPATIDNKVQPANSPNPTPQEH